MQITITGPRGGGSTTLAVEIARFLKEKGIEVHLMTRLGPSDGMLESLLEDPPPSKWNRSRVMIVDGVEPEDEQVVRHRGDEEE